MSSRRAGLENIKSADAPTSNASLWLNKWLDKKDDKDNTAKHTYSRLDKIEGEKDKKDDKDNTAKHNLVKEVVEKASNQEQQTLYKSFFKRWEQTLKDYGVKDENTRKARVRGRMVVGLGSESVLETSITLHHTYGVPYIPGSALKGLARHYAKNYVDGWDDNHNHVDGRTNEHSLIVFGNEKKSDDASAGYITFFDALYVPPQHGSEKFLHSDVMTVHHQDYYMKANVAPADWDDPIPVPFISATGTYLLALAGPEDWIEPTFKLLKLALSEEGIGAKTSSGYGRMTVI